MAEVDDSERSLSVLYCDARKTFIAIETSEESSSSGSYQAAVSDGIRICKEAIQMVNELSLFSDNEEVDELSSESLRYMTLPAFLGYFTSRCMKGDRKQNLESTKEYFMNFLKLCTDYSIQENPEESKSLEPGKQREQKVRRLKEKKRLETRITELEKYVEEDHVDEEIKREFYITQVKHWMLIAYEEIDSADKELPILEMMAKRGPIKETAPIKQPPFQSFIITRTRTQAQVYGAGYPSLPTYSVEEFYEMQARDGRLPIPGQNPTSGSGETGEDDQARKEEEEEQEERDDPEYLKKKRNWDEFKDDNRRGWGNRKNRG